MQMTEVLDRLKELQDILAEEYELEAKIEELPKSLTGSEESLEQFKKEFIEADGQYREEEERLSSIKTELEQVLRHREESEKSLSESTTHREFEVLEKQRDEAEARENELRKELKASEKNKEELYERRESSEILVKQTEEEVNAARQSLEQELSGYRSQVEDLKQKEQQVTGDIERDNGIGNETIIKFRRIIKRNRKGIVAVRGKVCEGCHMILPAQFVNEVHQGDKILFCPYCSRILFYEAGDVSYSSFASVDDSGALNDVDDEDLLTEDDADDVVQARADDGDDSAASYE